MTLDADAERWVPLVEAAVQLGLSRHQLRRRVRAGQLAGRQVVTPHGPAYEVRVDASTTVASAARHPGERNGDARATVTPPLTELVSLLREQGERAERNAAGTAMWQARCELLSIQLSQAQERIRALEAPRESTPAEIAPQRPAAASIFESNNAPFAIDEATPAPRRPWWRRAWRALAG